MNIDINVHQPFNSGVTASNMLTKKCPYAATEYGICPFNPFSGTPSCVKELPYLECTYDIIDTTNKTHLFTNLSYFCTRQSLDGGMSSTYSAAVYRDYQFSDTGEHVMRYYSNKPIIKVDDGSSRHPFLDTHRLIKVTGCHDFVEVSNTAFRGCENLKSVDLSRNCKILKMAAFMFCSSLEDIGDTSGIETIEGDFNYGAFRQCNIKRLHFGKSLTTIQDGAFYGGNIEELIIENPVPPTLGGGNVFSFATVNIYVPAKYLQTYKTHPMWSKWASSIFPI